MATDMPCNKYEGEVPFTAAFGMDRVMVEMRSGATDATVHDYLMTLNETRREVLRKFCTTIMAAMPEEGDEPRAPMCGFPATGRHDYKLEPHKRG